MSKERLENIKRIIKKVDKLNETGIWTAADDLLVDFHDYGHIKHLIEQAERVAELKEIITERHETVGDWIRKYNSLEDKNRQYREALKFYANKDNYEPFGDIMRGHIVVLVHQDKGTHAREALESESHED